MGRRKVTHTTAANLRTRITTAFLYLKTRTAQNITVDGDITDLPPVGAGPRVVAMHMVKVVRTARAIMPSVGFIRLSVRPTGERIALDSSPIGSIPPPLEYPTSRRLAASRCCPSNSTYFARHLHRSTRSATNHPAPCCRPWHTTRYPRSFNCYRIVDRDVPLN